MAITHSKYSAHTDPLFKKLNLLKLPDMYRLQVLKLFHKLANNVMPQFFQGIFTSLQPKNTTYNLRVNKLQYPCFKRTFARNSTFYQLSEHINTNNNKYFADGLLITTQVWILNLKSFVRQIKCKLISSYFEQCQQRNCYSCMQA